MGTINWDQTVKFIDRVNQEMADYFSRNPAHNDWRDFFRALGIAESSDNYGADNGEGYRGKYQWGDKIQETYRFFEKDGKCLGVNNWTDFKNNEVAQEIAALKEFSGLESPAASVYTQVRSIIRNKIDRTIDVNIYLDIPYTVKFSDGKQRTVILTEASISAAAHNIGPTSLAKLLYKVIKRQTIDINDPTAADGNRIAFTAYMELFQGFNIRPLIKATTKEEYDTFLAQLLEDNGLLDEFLQNYVSKNCYFITEGVIEKLKQKEIASETAGGSPLVLDLDGDGIETTGVKAGTYFDHDSNGFEEQTGWTLSDDGLLVFDRNNNGVIDDGRELFCNQTILKNGTQAANGFQALAE